MSRQYLRQQKCDLPLSPVYPFRQTGPDGLDGPRTRSARVREMGVPSLYHGPPSSDPDDLFRLGGQLPSRGPLDFSLTPIYRRTYPQEIPGGAILLGRWPQRGTPSYKP